MRLRRLDLKAIGPFRDVAIDLSGGNHGLHVIYGPNEAGKTSALRSLNCLLFGFSHRAADVSFQVVSAQLRVGAVLEGADGSTLVAVRRKGRAQTLRDGDDVAPADEARLAGWLGGMTEDTFRLHFGIDAERLRQAGEEIRQGKGQFANALFAAASGLRGVQAAQTALQKQMDELFKPAGKNQRITQTIHQLRELKTEHSRLMLRSEDWVRADEALREAQRLCAALDEQINAKRKELGRHERIERALPLIARHDELFEQLARLGPVPRLRPDFEAGLRTVQTCLAQESRLAQEAEARMGALTSELGELAVPDAVLSCREEIETLSRDRGQYRKGRADLPRRKDDKKTCEQRACDLLQELGRPPRLADAQDLSLRSDEALWIRNHGAELGRLRERCDETAAAIERHRSRLRELDHALSAVPEAPRLDHLRVLVQQGRKAGNLDEQVANLRERLASKQQVIELALRRLPGWTGTSAEIEALPIPLQETLALRISQWNNLTELARGIADKIAAKQAQIEHSQQELLAIARTLNVPTEADLTALRVERDELWAVIRGRWLHDRPIEESDRPRTDPAMADAYEQGVHQSDSVADQLRREADRIAAKAACQDQLTVAEGELEALLKQQAHTEARQAEWQALWERELAALRLAGFTPAELNDWLAKRSKIVELITEQRETSCDLARFEALRSTRIDQVRQELQAAASSAGNATTGELEAWLEHAQNLLTAHEQRERTRGKLGDERHREVCDLEHAEDRQRTAAAELAAWRDAWSQRIKPLGLKADATPEQANLYLEKVKDLNEQLRDARSFQQRIDGIERDLQDFESRVAELSARLGRPLEGEDHDQQAKRLADELNEADRLDVRRTELGKQLATEQSKARKARHAAAQAQTQLDQLVQEAACARPEELNGVIELARRRDHLELLQAECDEQLRHQSAGATLESFITEVREEDPDALGPAIQALQEQIERLEDGRREVNQTVGSRRLELSQMDGAEKAALAAEEIQRQLADLCADSREYARLKLAALVLKRGVERFREKNQDPVIRRASELFALLTCGSFEGLCIECDERGEMALMGKRPEDGSLLLGVEAMSDGTHDQLYLALRLASLEQWLELNEPLPFIVDDILLNFDNQRAAAALQALAQLSRRTQVIFFTHHEHLVELAEQTLPPTELFVQLLN